MDYIYDPSILWKKQCPETKGLGDNTNLLFTKKLIGLLNVDWSLLIYQR